MYLAHRLEQWMLEDFNILMQTYDYNENLFISLWMLTNFCKCLLNQVTYYDMILYCFCLESVENHIEYQKNENSHRNELDWTN